MSNENINKKDIRSNVNERSEQEIIEEEIKNQETINIFIESDKNWS